MTRTSNNNFVAIAGGLLALAAASAAVPQETPADRYARSVADAEVTARYNVQIEQQVQSQQQDIAALEAQLATLETTALDLQPLLQRMRTMAPSVA